ncbi:MAG TPA: TVP38/TMEM64 family protein [Chthoniobacteraceae bacterium]|jgi:uncharacterized membrane protein YdjX (TVP38/TMEM64 family)|nr:TVP38/TMEM64 family protein [Chthoniobacteraceae bacterium]
MSRVRRALFLQLAGAAAAVVFVVWLSRHYPVLDWITQAQEHIAAMGRWGGALYPLLFAACNVLLLPAGTLAIGSGLFFGLWWGFLLNVAASVMGAAVAFSISRWAARGWVRRHFLRHRKWAALDEAVAREGWKIIFLTQVHPLAPSSLLNYLYGVTRIPFRTCMLWIAIGQAPGAFLYAYLGTLAQHGLRLLRGQSHPRPIEYFLWIGGLLLAFFVTTRLSRLALRLLAEAEEKFTPPAAPAPTVEPPAGHPEAISLEQAL